MKNTFFSSCLFLLMTAACASPSVKDLRAEGELETRKLARLLAEIETKEQLQKKLSKIELSYVKLSDLMIQVRHLPSDLPYDEEASEASDELFIELARLYEMPGFRKLLESAQKTAIEKLKAESIVL